jgi:DNA-binding response OmpR family regulator
VSNAIDGQSLRRRSPRFTSILVMNTESAQKVILLLEPEILIRLVVAQYLRECGYTVIEGVSATDFRILIESGREIHVVLADVNLANGTSGFELAQGVRQTNPEIDIILTSGIAGTAVHAHDLCDESPIKKPYHPKDVESRIRILLERRRASDGSGGLK